MNILPSNGHTSRRPPATPLAQPRRLSRLDQACELLAVALGVHAGPEAAMAIDVELAVAGEFDKGFAFEHAILFLREVVAKIAMEEEKAAVDPVIFDVGFFGKTE